MHGRHADRGCQYTSIHLHTLLGFSLLLFISWSNNPQEARKPLNQLLHFRTRFVRKARAFCSVNGCSVINSYRSLQRLLTQINYMQLQRSSVTLGHKKEFYLIIRSPIFLLWANWIRWGETVCWINCCDYKECGHKLSWECFNVSISSYKQT